MGRCGYSARAEFLSQSAPDATHYEVGETDHMKCCSMFIRVTLRFPSVFRNTSSSLLKVI